MAQPNTTISTLTPAQYKQVSDALQLLLTASIEDQRELVHDLDGVDTRIDLVHFLSSFKAEAVDIAVEQLHEERLSYEEQAEQLEAQPQGGLSAEDIFVLREKVDDLYTSALHAQASVYSVASYHQHHTIVSQERIEGILKDVLSGHDGLIDSDSYQRLDQELQERVLDL